MSKKPIQVFYIHGAPTFKNRKQYVEYISKRGVYLDSLKRWHGDFLSKKLGKWFKVVKTQMPNPDNGIYKDRKIHFERLIPLLDEELIIIWNSLWGIFIVKYLSENKFPKKLISLYLVAAPYDNNLVKASKFSIPWQELVGWFTLGKDLSRIEKVTKNIHLLYSSDDEIVALAHAEKYKKKLKSADLTIFDNVKGHFRTTEFPEIVKMIKQDIKK